MKNVKIEKLRAKTAGKVQVSCTLKRAFGQKVQATLKYAQNPGRVLLHFIKIKVICAAKTQFENQHKKIFVNAWVKLYNSAQTPFEENDGFFEGKF